MRVFVLNASDLAPKNGSGGKSDPYLTLRILGKRMDTFVSYIDDSKSALANTLNPRFNTYYELDAVFPGSTKLEISVMDAGPLGFDSLIGSTVVDLEDRWMDEGWKQSVNKGEFITETRPLWNSKVSPISQGQISLWIEMYK